MKKAFAIGFFLFLCFMIYIVNTNAENPFDPLFRLVPHADKIGHLVLYGTLAFLVNLAIGFKHFQSKLYPPASRFLQMGSIVVLAFSLAEELSQHYFPTRTLDILDALCDVIGVGFVTIISAWLAKREAANTNSNHETTPNE